MKSKTDAIDALFALESIRRRRIRALQQEFFRQQQKRKPSAEVEATIPMMQPIHEDIEGYIAGLVRAHKEIDKRRKTKRPLPLPDERVIREMMENAAELGRARMKR